jgi:uncharacterized protein
MKNLAARHPFVFSLLVILVPVIGMKLGLVGLQAYFSELTVRLVVAALFCGYVTTLVTLLGWWRDIGFTRPRRWRAVIAYAPWLLLPLLMVMTGGVRGGSPDRVVAFTAFALMVGFAEEILLRGVALWAMLPRGVMQAVVLSSIFFGLAHLFNILQGRDTQSAIVQAIYATFIGIGFAGPRLYSGTILPAILLHALIDFADQVVRGFVLAQPTAVSVQQAGVLIAITGLYALYGWWLTRRCNLSFGSQRQS